MRTREEIQADIDRLNEEMKALEWKPTRFPVLVYCTSKDTNDGGFVVLTEEQHGNDFWNYRPANRDEALALVDEPAPKTRYDWSKAPEWAQWAATSHAGLFAWFEDKPQKSEAYNGYWGCECRFENIDYAKECIDWRDSLERRPEGI